MLIMYGVTALFILVTAIMLINVNNSRNEIETGYMILENSSLSEENKIEAPVAAQHADDSSPDTSDEPQADSDTAN